MDNHTKPWTDIEKLEILLPHWLNHGDGHIRDQEKWIKPAKDAGLMDVAEELQKAVDHSKQVNHHIAQASLCLKNKKATGTPIPEPEKAETSAHVDFHNHVHSHIHFHPIGIIHTPYTDKAPHQSPDEDPGDFYIMLDPQYQEGLKDLERFRFIYVLYHLDRSQKTPSLTAHPPWTEDTHVGLFASRSPARPNAIGLSVVQIKRIENNRVTTSGLDVFDGTPLLDIKPYIKDLDSKPEANNGWLDDIGDKDHLMMHIKGIPH